MKIFVLYSHSQWSMNKNSNKSELAFPRLTNNMYFHNLIINMFFFLSLIINTFANNPTHVRRFFTVRRYYEYLPNRNIKHN